MSLAFALIMAALPYCAQSATTNALPGEIEGQARIELHSADIWRGRTLADAPFLSPGATLQLSDTIWIVAEAAISLGNDRERTDAANMSSIGMSLWRHIQHDDTILNVGIKGYAHPEDDQNDDALEVFLQSNWIWNQVVASLAAFHALDENFTYGYGSLQYLHEITPDLDFNAGLRIGASSDDFSPMGYGGWHDILLNNSVSYTGLSLCDVVVALAYTGSLDRDVLPSQAVNRFGIVHVSRAL